MRILTDKYINPFTDSGFKRLFGEEVKQNLSRQYPPFVTSYVNDGFNFYRPK